MLVESWNQLDVNENDIFKKMFIISYCIILIKIGGNRDKFQYLLATTKGKQGGMSQ